MAIKLDILKPSKQTEVTLQKGYLYKDLKLDLKTSYTESSELNSLAEKRDLQPIFDTESIINAVKNILTTLPGQKILNPTFGLDLLGYLFESVTTVNAYFLGEDIIRGISGQDERLVVETINVVAVPDELLYEIDLVISVPSLKIYGLSLAGILNKDGYSFV